MPSACAPSSLTGRHQVAIARGEVDHVSMPMRCSASAANAMQLMRTRAIGLSQCRCWSARFFQQGGALQHPGRVEAARRIDLDADDKLARFDLARQLRLLFGWAIGAVGLEAGARLGVLDRGGDLRPDTGQCCAHRGDVGRRRAAAAANHRHTGFGESARVVGEVLGRRHVHLSTALVRRRAGVGHRRQWRRGHTAHVQDGVERGLRPDPTVHPEHVHAQLFERAHDRDRRCAGERVAVLVHAHLGHDR
jgi:hypothetical protein